MEGHRPDGKVRVKGKDLKNGVRYKVVAITDEGDEDPYFELRRVKDEGEVVGESFLMDKMELGSRMRLTHAITYFSSQARTIVGGLRVAQNSRGCSRLGIQS